MLNCYHLKEVLKHKYRQADVEQEVSKGLRDMKAILSSEPLNFVRDFHYPELKLQSAVNMGLADIPNLADWNVPVNDGNCHICERHVYV